MTIKYIRAAGALLAITVLGIGLPAMGIEPEEEVSTDQRVVDVVNLPGTLQATFTQDSLSGAWVAHISGTYVGLVSDMFLYTADTQGRSKDRIVLDLGQIPPPSTSPFQYSFAIPPPPVPWSNVGIGMHVTSATNSTYEVLSTPFPLLDTASVLIDHAYGSSTIAAPNYVPGGIPAGIGIPHTLINSLPEGDYYADVFFAGNIGCPSQGYAINSFRAGAYWGYDVRGAQGAFSTAWSTSGGGCMQLYHVDPHKGDDWLWGALSPTGTSSALTDAHGIPAFAICATERACDPISPHADTSTTPPQGGGISSVLFLPGIKGSKLYEHIPLCILPGSICDLQLWLPLADLGVPELFMDAAGKSKKNVYAKEDALLDIAYGYGFYDSFLQMLSTAQEEKAFGPQWSYRVVPYDWRLSLPDLISGGVEQDGRISYGESEGIPYIEASLRELASTSPTGKVSIVAHSNGGLVAKALLKKLGDAEAGRLVDSLVLVGTPQSGAPRALGALLYGISEGIPGSGTFPSLIMSAAHAREFSHDSPMAYHLLPSASYLAHDIPSQPLVHFGDGELLSAERSAFGADITTSDELHRYVLGEEGGRIDAEKSDLEAPSLLNPTLLSYAETEHASLDVWSPPASMQVYQIGGYGVGTISGIDEYEQLHQNGSSTLSYRPRFTRDGDGTVPTISAFMMNASARVHHLWVDLERASSDQPAYTHANLLNAPTVQSMVRRIVSGTLPSSAFTSLSANSLGSEHRIAFFVHSPVVLSVTNSGGQETQVLSDESWQAHISGSEAGVLGTARYIVVPSDDTYTLTIRGEDTGTFTLDLQDLVGDAVTASSTLSDIPTTHLSTASLVVSQSIGAASSLQVDTDLDGYTDISVTPERGKTVFPPTLVPTKEFPTESSLRRIQHVANVPSESIQSIHEAFSTTTEMKQVSEPILAKAPRVQEVSDVRGTSTSAIFSVSTSTLPTEIPKESKPKTPRWWERILAFLRAFLVQLLSH